MTGKARKPLPLLLHDRIARVTRLRVETVSPGFMLDVIMREEARGYANVLLSSSRGRGGGGFSVGNFNHLYITYLDRVGKVASDGGVVVLSVLLFLKLLCVRRASAWVPSVLHAYGGE